MQGWVDGVTRSLRGEMRPNRERKGSRPTPGAAFLWGAAHALDIGGVLQADEDWRGFAADAEAIHSYWEVATEAASSDVAETREKG